MTRIAALAVTLLVLAGCASSGGYDGSNRNCNEDGDLLVRVGGNVPGVGLERSTDQLTILVDVSNNMRHPIVVKAIRLEQTMAENAPYRFENGYRTFNETIEEDSDHTFEIPTTGTVLRDRLSERHRQWSDALAVAVTVSLEDGTDYRCQFAIPAPR